MIFKITYFRKIQNSAIRRQNSNSQFGKFPFPGFFFPILIWRKNYCIHARFQFNCHFCVSIHHIIFFGGKGRLGNFFNYKLQQKHSNNCSRSTKRSGVSLTLTSFYCQTKPEKKSERSDKSKFKKTSEMLLNIIETLGLRYYNQA